jgi:hypothetical protein
MSGKNFRDSAVRLMEMVLWDPCRISELLFGFVRGIHRNEENIRGCIQKFPDWPPGAGTANGTAF